MKNIILAKTAGFCFGVNRAVNLVYELSDKEKVCTLGPIIHNTEMVKELEKKGVLIADNPSDVKNNYTVVIRSHGVAKSVYDEINSLGLKYADATCPFVSKIHKKVAKAGKENSIVLIIGDKNHPEVKGIEGHCNGEFFTVKYHDQVEKLINDNPKLKTESVTVVSQTTFDVSEWKKSLKIIKKLCTNAVIFDTICNATAERQEEARSLAEKVDLMIVIGDKTSSNTCKLYDICKRVCSKTYLVETYRDLSTIDFSAACNIGVTAGASAPARIIKEVLDTMAQNQVNSSEEKELDFASMLEEHMQSFNTDGRVKGVVERITPSEIFVDVGRKQAGVVKLNELTDDPNAKAEELVKVGDTLDLLIMRTNDQEGTIMLSKKRVDAQKGWDVIKEALESKEILSGVVTEINNGGVIAITNGVKVFIPASQATATRGESTEALLKKNVSFRIIDVNDRRKRAVGSIRSVLNEEKNKAKEEFWANCEVGKVYTGTVKSLTSYGAFVDIGGVDGMIHISELSWNRVKHPSEVVSVGDTVEVYVKDIDTEKNNISLGYKKAEDNPWEIMKNNYPEGTVAEVEIVGLTQFGAFAKIIPGIDGLIHISQIANRRIEKPQDELTVGQKVQAKVTAVDFENKRVSLSIRALLQDEEPAEAETEEATEE
ncbi:MAG: bifunctional 4-hydroxy-3-methylbut-2-enyl diphosphate reductase/30S ribosomal protein S1 [Acutalibacteraceae bacterium]|nr:bifunctional 4-hydroxy-3-methylbut-2-enyl diphosphate reductase/30S ribosomal protein S1 [Acutalibacteraceae bacterium]